MSLPLFEQRLHEQDFLSKSVPPESQLLRGYWTLPANVDRRAEGGKRLQKSPGKNIEGAPPLVSLITAAYNVVGTINKCFESVRTQTYGEIEYLVIDGGSDDGTVDFLQKHASDIDYFVSEPDGGIYDAMNKGLGLAAGEYIIFLNADDWYRSDAIELLVQAALKKKADISHANAVIVNANGRKIGRIKRQLHDGIYTSICLIRHETMLVHRSVYIQLGGYDTSYRIIADYLFAMRAYYSGFRFSQVHEGLLYFSNSGISNTAKTQLASERSKLFSSLFPFLEPHDINLLVRWPLSITEVSALISRYQDQSELFIRSLATNITKAPSVLIAQVAFERLERILRNNVIWKKSGQMLYWIYDRLGRFLRNFNNII
ncbi:MAG: glycosyltransferase [Candidatus Electrothrix sp. AW3_4]|nr:glycosyltransferase [Candidatus Electrothrix gigas]